MKVIYIPNFNLQVSLGEAAAKPVEKGSTFTSVKPKATMSAGYLDIIDDAVIRQTREDSLSSPSVSVKED